MPKIKNKDGSINWDEIKINPVINTTWGDVNESHKDVIDEIKTYINKRYNEALEDINKEVYNPEDLKRRAMKLGKARICQEILEFIDSITEL